MRKIAALGLLLALSACGTMSIDPIPYTPDPNVKGVTPARAKQVLTEILGRARTVFDKPLDSSRVDDDRLHYAYKHGDHPFEVDVAFAPDVTTRTS